MTAPQASGADRVSGATTSPLRLEHGRPRPRHPAARRACSAANSRIRPASPVRLRIGHRDLHRRGRCTWPRRGPGSFYATAGFADYPPGYLYVLWLIGRVGHVLAPLGNADPIGRHTAADQAPGDPRRHRRGLVLYRLVRAGVAPRGTQSAGALVPPACTCSTRSPGTTRRCGARPTRSARWSCCSTVAALVRGNCEGAVRAGRAGRAHQAPVRRRADPARRRRAAAAPPAAAGHGPRTPRLAPARLRGWFETEQGPMAAGLLGGRVACCVLIARALPFSLDIFEFLAPDAADRRRLSVPDRQRLQPVGAGRVWRPGAIAFGGGWSSDTVPLLGPAPGRAHRRRVAGAGLRVRRGPRLLARRSPQHHHRRHRSSRSASSCSRRASTSATCSRSSRCCRCWRGRPALAGGVDRAVGGRVHQPARRPHDRAVRHAQPRGPAAGRALPPAIRASSRASGCTSAASRSSSGRCARRAVRAGSSTPSSLRTTSSSRPSAAVDGADRRRRVSADARQPRPGTSERGRADRSGFIGNLSVRRDRSALLVARGRRPARPARPAADRWSSSARCSCGRIASRCPTRCTSTRSTTRARRSSSCRTGATGCRTTSTSSRTPTWPSTPWRSGS